MHDIDRIGTLIRARVSCRRRSSAIRIDRNWERRTGSLSDSPIEEASKSGSEFCLTTAHGESASASDFERSTGRTRGDNILLGSDFGRLDLGEERSDGEDLDEVDDEEVFLLASDQYELEERNLETHLLGTSVDDFESVDISRSETEG